MALPVKGKTGNSVFAGNCGVCGEILSSREPAENESQIIDIVFMEAYKHGVF